MMKKKKVLSLRIIVILIIIGVVLFVGNFTVAKYIIEEFHSYYLNSKHFYFTSNRLKKNNPIYLVNNWSGVGTFEISFNLLSIKNDLVYSDYDIPYEVTPRCPTGVSCVVDKPTGTVYKNSQEHSDKVTVTVTPSRSYGENEHLVVVIEAQSTSPYVEKLSATFEYVVGKQGITYAIEDEANRPYMIFKITSAISYCTVIEDFGDYHVDQQLDSSVYRQLSATDKLKCVGEPVIITFDPTVTLLDTTSDIIKTATIGNTTISGVSYVNRLDFNLEPLSTRAIKFYKTAPSNNYTYPHSGTISVITVSFPNS